MPFMASVFSLPQLTYSLDEDYIEELALLAEATFDAAYAASVRRELERHLTCDCCTHY